MYFFFYINFSFVPYTAMPGRRRRDLADFDDMYMEENVEERAEGIVNRLEDLLGALRKIE